jgi:rSAM/selenodomain-associated transferase 1
MNEAAIIIMAKEPKIGYTKTRLTPPLSPINATRLYEALLRDTIELLSNIENLDLAIAATPPESNQYFEKICPANTLIIPVTCSDIGDCLKKVLGNLLERGYSKVMALNADSPALPLEYIYDAIHQLETKDLVFGPTQDGGYYLVGLRKLYEDIFIGIEWSTDKVLSESRSKANQLGLKTGILSTWFDIDSIDDVKQLEANLNNFPTHSLFYTKQLLRSDLWKNFR